MKAETGENLTDLRFERVAIARNKFVLEFLVTVGNGGVFGALVVEFRHAAGERLHFFFDGMKLGKHGQTLGENGLAGEGEAVLRKVSDGNIFGARDGAVVERFAPGKDFHYRGLAGAVRSNQANAGFWRNQPVGVFEQELVAIALAGSGKLDHGSLSIVS